MAARFDETRTVNFNIGLNPRSSDAVLTAPNKRRMIPNVSDNIVGVSAGADATGAATQNVKTASETLAVQTQQLRGRSMPFSERYEQPGGVVGASGGTAITITRLV